MQPMAQAMGKTVANREAPGRKTGPSQSRAVADRVPKRKADLDTQPYLPCSLDFACNSCHLKDLAHSRKLDRLFSKFCRQQGEGVPGTKH